MPTSSTPTLPSDLGAPEELLHTLLDVSLTGVLLLRPIYNAAGDTITDLAYEYLNPAAQQILRLPPRPAESLLTRFPLAGPAGIFTFYRGAFLSGQTQRAAFNFQHDGIDGFFHLVARRQGPLLLVSFLDTTDPLHAAQEEALRLSQARELAAQAKTEAEAKRTQQAQVQREILSQILGQVPAAIATLRGPEHRFVFLNEQYAHLTANRVKPGDTVAEALPEVVEQGFIGLLDQVYTSGQAYVGREIAIMIAQAAGPPAQHYLDFTYQPLTNDQGQVQGILVFAADVTAQVLARRQATTLQAAMLAVTRRQVQQREELYQVLEQAPAAIALLREPNHRLEYVNPTYAAFFPGVALQGRLLAEAHPTSTESGVIARLDRVYETGEPYVGEEQPIELSPAPGQPSQTHYFNFTYYPYREAGRIVGVSLFAYDVTKPVVARQQQEQRLQTIFEQAPVAIFVLSGPTHVLEVVNAAMSEMLGRPAAALLGKPYFEAVPELATQGYPEYLAQVWQTGQPVVVQESPARLARHQSHETGYFTFVYQPLFGADQVVTGIICVAVEVTVQVLARQQVQNLNEELAGTNETLSATNETLQSTNIKLLRTNADLDTFVYTASHDLKSPITNIEGIARALRQHLPASVLESPVVLRLFEALDNAATRFQTTLGYLTDVSRLQHAQAPPLETIDLPALVEAVRLDILPELTAANATLEVDLAACSTIRSSAKNLRSIIYNLLSNAVKYRAADRLPLVQLRCRRVEPSQLLLEVQDNGLGLSEQQQSELFRMFRRLHTHVAGSGVGLYLIKRLIENAGGTITVQSQLGVGSTFTVTLPSKE